MELTAFEKVYRLSPSDTVFLYNAATVSTESKNYNCALKLYQELKDLGYDGDEILFIATNRDIGQEESFADKKQRDLALKSGAHRKPREKRYPSKRTDIIKNIVFIYVKQGKVNEALKAFEEAKKLYPKDASIILAKANVYLLLDNKEKFKQLMQETTQLEPKNSDIQYNIGVINMQQGNI